MRNLQPELPLQVDSQLSKVSDIGPCSDLARSNDKFAFAIPNAS
eukprot:SAG31_NODE_1810_length_7224_cov_1.969965_5_plen_44_part_00